MIAEVEVVAEFENAVSEYLGMAGGVATSSGTMALFLALKALDISHGDEVIIPTYVCRAVLDAVNYTGAMPVLCDVGDDWCMNVETVKYHVTAQTKAIVLVHTFGISADAKVFEKIGVPVIEDCCQSFGGVLHGKRLGSWGKLCICSFHAIKLLTTGEGGMVLTNDEILLHRLRELKYGVNKGYKLRYLFPMTDLQAALGLSQLRRFDEFLTRRRQIADVYFSKLDDLSIQLPENIRGRSIFFRFPIRTQKGFESLRIAFDKLGIQVRRGVDALLHYGLGLTHGSFPVSEMLFNQTVSIPLYPALTSEEVEHIIEVCHKFLPEK